MFMAITVAIVGSMLAAWDFVKVSVSETIKLMWDKKEAFYMSERGRRERETLWKKRHFWLFEKNWL